MTSIVNVVSMFSVVIWLCLVLYLHQSPVCMCWFGETEWTNKTSKLGGFVLLLERSLGKRWTFWSMGFGMQRVICGRGRAQCPEPGLGLGGQPWRKALGLVQELVGGHCSMALRLEQPTAGSAAFWYHRIRRFHCLPFPLWCRQALPVSLFSSVGSWSGMWRRLNGTHPGQKVIRQSPTWFWLVGKFCLFRVENILFCCNYLSVLCVWMDLYFLVCL